MRKLLLAATAAVAIAAPAAAVTNYDFTLTRPGVFTYTWTLPASPVPSFYGDFGFNMDAVDVNGVSSYFTFNSSSNNGGFRFYRPPTFVTFNGPTLYTGTTAAPTFTLGNFALSFSGIDLDLTIAAQSVGGVPEPASWAMLIAGFGLTGAAMRRRRISTIAA
jgi:opacity protein-like surface antigen